MWHSGVCFKRRYVMVYGIFAFFGICRPFSVDSPAKTERVWLFKVPIKERNVPLLISVIIIIALTGLDQLTKHLATVYLAPVGAMPFIPGVMELRYVLNDGAAFSMLADAEWGRVFLIVVTGLALAALAASGADLVILDIMMPFVDGMTCLREMRKRKIDTPVIMLTARGEEYDKLAGLEGGADDYVVKPFSPRELVARVKVVLARTMPKTQEGGESFVFGDLVIDTASHSVKIAGEEAPLTPKEFDLLVFLVSNKGLALSREKILQKVWNYDYYGEDRTVDTHVKMLRSHLGKYRDIVTVWGIGYKFDPDVRPGK